MLSIGSSTCSTPPKVCEATTFITGIDEAVLAVPYGAINPAECDYEPWEDDLESALAFFLQLSSTALRDTDKGSLKM